MSANLTTLERDFNALVDIINSQEYDNSSPGLSVSDVERFQENLRGKDYCDFEGEKLPDLHKILNTILHVISTDSTILDSVVTRFLPT